MQRNGIATFQQRSEVKGQTHLGLGADGELVLVQQVRELRDVEVQELVQLVDLGEMELEEVLSRCLQVGTVHAVGQGGDTCRGGASQHRLRGGGVGVRIQVYLYASSFLPRQFVASICPLRNSTHIFFTGSIWYWLAASSSAWTLLLFTDILTHSRENVNNPRLINNQK